MSEVNSQSSLKTSCPSRRHSKRLSLHLTCPPLPMEKPLKWSVTPENFQLPYNTLPYLTPILQNLKVSYPPVLYP